MEDTAEQTHSDTQLPLIPLPFATAGIGLFLSYVFPRLGGGKASLLGFAVGLVILYFLGRSEVLTDASRGNSYPVSARTLPVTDSPSETSQTTLRCSNCGTALQLTVEGRPPEGV